MVFVVVFLRRGHEVGGGTEVHVGNADDFFEIPNEDHVYGGGGADLLELQVSPVVDHLLQVVEQVVLLGGAVADVLDERHVLVQLQVQHLLEVEVAVGHRVHLQPYFHAQDVPVPFVHAFVRQEDRQRDLLDERTDVSLDFHDEVLQFFGFFFVSEYVL